MRKFKFLGFLPVLALIAYAPRANAALDIYYSINGGAAVLCGAGADDGPVTCSISSGGISAAVVTSTSNSPGTTAGADQFGDTVEVTSTKTASLVLFLTAQDFTEPVAPPTLSYESSLSTSAALQTASTTTTMGLESCINTANAIATSAPLSCADSLTNTNETLTGNGSAANTVFNDLSSLTAPYSLQQMLTFSLVNGSNVNAITSQSLTPVPEPASVLLFGSLGLVIAAVLRRRIARNSVTGKAA